MPHLNLTKGHGSGDDVIVVDGRPGDPVPAGRLVRDLCDRAGPIGGNQVFFLDDRPVRPRVWCFGPDGVPAPASGEGLRVVGRVVLERREADVAEIEVDGEVRAVRRLPDSPEGVVRVGVELSAVDFEPVPPIVVGRPRLLGEIVPGLPSGRPVSAVLASTPCLVAAVGKYDELELAGTGAWVAAGSDVFPRPTSVSFLMPLGSTDEVFARTHAVGIGLTRACASGVAACRAVYSRLGAVDPDVPVVVREPGGPTVAWLRGWRPMLEGNATVVYEASIDTDRLGPGVRFDLAVRPAEIMAFAEFSRVNAEALEAAGVHYETV